MPCSTFIVVAKETLLKERNENLAYCSPTSMLTCNLQYQERQPHCYLFSCREGSQPRKIGLNALSRSATLLAALPRKLSQLAAGSPPCCSYEGLAGSLPPLCNRLPCNVVSLLQLRTGIEQIVLQAPCSYIGTSQALFGLSGPVLALRFLPFEALNGALAPLCLVVCLLGQPGCLGRSLAVRPALVS